jgi:CRP-like cAMP-binding protein
MLIHPADAGEEAAAMAAKRRPTGSPGQFPIGNRLLASLPPDEYRRLVPHLEAHPMVLKTVLYKPGEVVDAVYFPGGGFVSVVTVLANGDMVEVATIGSEGMVGGSAAVADYREPTLTMVQMASDACQRIPAAIFRREIDRHGGLHDVVARFSQALTGVVMQSTACNATHSIEQRLARWLLTARDRVGSDQFPLTQEFLAMMLGAARPTVTIVAGTLQRAGLITYRRGQIAILNAGQLEAASCECYQVTADLLASVSRRPARLRA